MTKWITVPDPASQNASRAVPFESARIRDETSVKIPESLNRKRIASSPEAQRVFDVLAMRMSSLFPYWKGTRVDFRFADDDGTTVFVLTPMKSFIRVEVRTDATGYSNRRGLFPTSPSAGAGYPGSWVRANISSTSDAMAIAEDVSRFISN